MYKRQIAYTNGLYHVFFLLWYYRHNTWSLCFGAGEAYNMGRMIRVFQWFCFWRQIIVRRDSMMRRTIQTWESNSCSTWMVENSGTGSAFTITIYNKKSIIRIKINILWLFEIHNDFILKQYYGQTTISVYWF